MTLYIGDTFSIRMLGNPVSCGIRLDSITEENAVEAFNRRTECIFRVQAYQAALLFTEVFKREVAVCGEWSLYQDLRPGDHFLLGSFIFEQSRVHMRGQPLFKPRINWTWIQVD